MEKEIGEELCEYLVEINKWLDYYSKNHKHSPNDTTLAINTFYELEKIFSEYAQYKFEEKGEK